MHVSAMKNSPSFNPKAFLAMLAICAAIAGTASWLTGLNFWILMAICIGAVLLNGFVATVEDRGKKEDDW